MTGRPMGRSPTSDRVVSLGDLPVWPAFLVSLKGGAKSCAGERTETSRPETPDTGAESAASGY